MGHPSGTGTHTYQFDAENRLKSIDNGSTATYTYNALGQRVEKNVAGVYTEYSYHPSGKEVAEHNRSTFSTQVIPFKGRHLAHYQNGATYFNHSNSLGTTSHVTDHTGAVAQDQLYYPWGQEQTMVGTAQEKRFAALGHRDETETGLDPTQHRMLSSTQGRWLSPDPAGSRMMRPANPQTLNRYAYVLNSPTHLVDPTGLCGGEDLDGACSEDAAAIGDVGRGGGGGGVEYTTTVDDGSGDLGQLPTDTGTMPTGIGLPDDNVQSTTTCSDTTCTNDTTVNVTADLTGPDVVPTASQPPDTLTPPDQTSPSNPPLDVNALQTAADLNAFDQCQAEAEAAANTRPSLVPNAESVIAGVVAAVFNVAIRGATVGNAAIGLLVGMGFKTTVTAESQGELFNGTYQACMSRNGVWIPDPTP